jgi:KaiC/GvpD/RAD55 family RecA-like ATPase
MAKQQRSQPAKPHPGAPRGFEQLLETFGLDEKKRLQVLRAIRKEGENLSAYVFGKLPPQDLPAEEAVLGALMLERDAFGRIRHICSEETFYLEAHQIVFRAIHNLHEQGAPIDLLTVTDWLRKNKLENTVGGSYRLVEMTGRVASTAHLEYHVRMLYQLQKIRELIRRCSETIRRAYELEDVFDLYDQMHLGTKLVNPTALLRIRSMTEVVVKGAQAKPRRHLMGSLLRESDVCFIFGDEGCSKSILAFQIGDAVAAGRSAFVGPEFYNECTEGKKTIILDFELDDEDVADRYSEEVEAEFSKERTKAFHRFSDNFFRADINPECEDLKDLDLKIMRQIETLVEFEHPELLIIDNLSWLVSESHDPGIATAFVRKLMTISRRYAVSVLVVAHTPKRNTAEPLEARHLAGAKALSNFATNVIGIGISKLDSHKRYIKHIKNRKGIKVFTEENVATFTVAKSGPNLIWEYDGTTVESIHLSITDREEFERDMLERCMDLLRQGYSYRRIAEKTGHVWSHEKIRQKTNLREAEERTQQDRLSDQN